MATYIPANRWRKKCLSDRPLTTIAPIHYKWTCGRVRLRSYLGWELDYIRNSTPGGNTYFGVTFPPYRFKFDLEITPAKPYPRAKKLRKGKDKWKLRREGITLAERNSY